MWVGVGITVFVVMGGCVLKNFFNLWDFKMGFGGVCMRVCVCVRFLVVFSGDGGVILLD